MNASANIVFRVNQLAEELRRIGEDAFRQGHATPFLVLKSCHSSNDECMNPKTVVSPSSDDADDADGGESDLMGMNFIPNVTSIPLLKTPRNAYASKIMVGRAKNNDIIIRDPKVSKLHASLAKEQDGSYTLIDMGSANGTFHNTTRLAHNKPVRLKNGDRISFYQYEFEFVELAEMIKRLHLLPPSGA